MFDKHLFTKSICWHCRKMSANEKKNLIKHKNRVVWHIVLIEAVMWYFSVKTPIYLFPKSNLFIVYLIYPLYIIQNLFNSNNTSQFNLHWRNVHNPLIAGGHRVFFLCDTFISMCIAPSSFQTKDSPSGKIGGQTDKVILAQNTADTRSNTETHVHA